MSKTNLPGFTAEASLYRMSGHYQSVATQSYSSGEQWVISQLRASGGIGGTGLTIDPEQCELRCYWICGRYGCFPTNCYWVCF